MTDLELLATDETFREVADLLFGAGGDEFAKSLLSKANPDAASLHVPSAAERKKKAEKLQARVGLATNVIGLGAGAAATPAAFKAVGEARRNLKGDAPKPAAKHRSPGKVGRLKAVQAGKQVLGNKKVAVGLAAGGAGLQVANLGGDVIANRVLSRAAKDNPDVKGGSDTLVRHAKKKVDDKFSKRFKPIEQPEEVAKSGDVVWEGEFSKMDSDKRQVFGWASVVSKDGKPVEDLQGDTIEIEEMEKSAYSYVVKSRKGGNQHQRAGDEPLHVADMIESFLVTPEKIEKMGLPETTPLGWWVGYQINDDATWADVKSGKLTGFSVHGRGKRTPV